MKDLRVPGAGPLCLDQGAQQAPLPPNLGAGCFSGGSCSYPISPQMPSAQQSIWDAPLPPAELGILAQGGTPHDAGVCPPFAYCIPPLSQGHGFPSLQVGH